MTGLKRTLRSRRGFTLVELIVVLVILGITASIGVPALTGYVDNAKEKQAVSEAQACVETATRIGAQKYALVQSAVMTGDTGSDNANALTKWAGTLDTKAPPVSGGTVALTEGSGQYLLNVSDPPSGGIATMDDLAGIAGVSGHVSTMTCNANGQVLYLVYTSADGIQVVYTATGTTASVSGDDGTVVVPKPDDGKTDPEPDKPDVPDVPTVKKLDVTFKIVDANTGENVIGATMKVMQGTSDFERQWETTTDSPTYTLQLTAGSYTYQEFNSPDEYYKEDTPIRFSIRTDSNGNLYVKDNSNVTVNGTSVTVTMRVKKKAVSETTMKVTFVKKDSYTDGLLEGAQLRIVDENGKVVHSWTSQKGTSEKIDLPAGSYYYEEVEAPAHYKKATSIYFTLAKENPKKNDLKLSCDDLNVKKEDIDAKRIVMKDAPETTTVVFWASDEAHNNLSGVPLKLTGDLVSTRPSKDREWISDSNIGHKLEIPLVPGTYQFMVDDDKKYTENQDFAYYTPMWVKFEVDDNGKLRISSEHSNAGGKDDTTLDGEAYLVKEGNDIGLHLICKTKSRQLNSVSLFKKDTAGKALAGAEFTITDTVNNNLVANVTSSDAKDNTSITAALSGKTLIYYNKVYCLHETKAPSGYKLAADVYFKIALENGETVLYSSNSMDGPFTLTSGNYITVVDAMDNGFTIIAKDKTTASFDPLPWPTEGLTLKYDPKSYNNRFFDANGNIVDASTLPPIKKGAVYYHDVNGVRRYFAAIADVPKITEGTYMVMEPESCVYNVEIKFDYFLTKNDTDRVELKSDGNYYVNNVYTSEIILYDGKLYIARFAEGYPNPYPPIKDANSWILIEPEYYSIIKYTKDADPDGEANGLYKEFLN